jgi:hypothetical protein
MQGLTYVALPEALNILQWLIAIAMDANKKEHG